MRLVPFAVLTVFAASQAMACVAPERGLEGDPLVVRDDCSFKGAGGLAGQGGLTWHAGPAYRLANGLVAQSVLGLGFCYEALSVVTLIVDCPTRRSTIVSNHTLLEFEPSVGQAGPGLPAFLEPEDRKSFDTIAAHERVSTIDMRPVWTEPDRMTHPDPLCGCGIGDLPTNE